MNIDQLEEPQLPHVAFMLHYVVKIQIIWGVCLIARPSLATFAPIGGANVFTSFGLPVAVSGALFLLFALVAGIGAHLHERNPAKDAWFYMLLPQYIFVIFASFLDGLIIASGEYRGRDIDRFLLLALLGPVLVAAWYHSKAVVERYVIWKALRLL